VIGKSFSRLFDQSCAVSRMPLCPEVGDSCHEAWGGRKVVKVKSCGFDFFDAKIGLHWALGGRNDNWGGFGRKWGVDFPTASEGVLGLFAVLPENSRCNLTQKPSVFECVSVSVSVHVSVSVSVSVAVSVAVSVWFLCLGIFRYMFMAMFLYMFR